MHRGRSLSVAQVVPTTRSSNRSENDSCNDSGDSVSSNGDSDHGSTTFEEGEDYINGDTGGGFQPHNDSSHRSFRLNSNSFAAGTLQRNVTVHVTPNQRRYTSFRLRQSECVYSNYHIIIIVTVCASM